MPSTNATGGNSSRLQRSLRLPTQGNAAGDRRLGLIRHRPFLPGRPDNASPFESAERRDRAISHVDFGTVDVIGFQGRVTMTTSRTPGMSPLRSALLLLSLGWAAAIGWLCQPSGRATGCADIARSSHGPRIDPSHTPPPSFPHHPTRRQKTRPDPTPEDQSLPLARDCGDEGPGSFVQVVLDLPTSRWLTHSSSRGWTEPGIDTVLLQITHRFRC